MSISFFTQPVNANKRAVMLISTIRVICIEINYFRQLLYHKEAVESMTLLICNLQLPSFRYKVAEAMR